MITYLLASTGRSAASGLIERREYLELGGKRTSLSVLLIGLRLAESG